MMYQKRKDIFMREYKSFYKEVGGNEGSKCNYNKTRRIHRGLFVSNNGTKINADVNGAYQIMKKVFPNIFNDNGWVETNDNFMTTINSSITNLKE